MTFERPAMLLMLYALIPIIILMIVNYKLRFIRVYSLIAPLSTVFYDDMNVSSKKKSRVFTIKSRLCIRYIASSLFFIIFFICMCFAFSGPRFGVYFVREFHQGADVVFAFDLSRSMNVRDAAPLPSLALATDGQTGAAALRGGLSSSRIERSIYIAKAALENIVSTDGLSKDVRFGVAFGKGEAILAVPLTSDIESMFVLLDSLTDIAITSRGTNLEKILDAAAGAFHDNFPATRSIALFSDGEALTGSLTAAIERLRQREVKVFAVGVGSIYGAVVPAQDSFETINSTGKKPETITSYLRQDMLSNASERTGGVYIDGGLDTAPEQLAALLKSNGISPGKDGLWTFREESSSQWQLFVIAAVISFILLKLCSLRLKKSPAR
ncbi:MAG: VWA domain-containing protein [Spirochaetaceae bacterium]|jgi:Ca-activated chloride channel family protein|nr:VWA domain-containing protein [Spirochaetaceae bacterium]